MLFLPPQKKRKSEKGFHDEDEDEDDDDHDESSSDAPSAFRLRYGAGRPSNSLKNAGKVSTALPRRPGTSGRCAYTPARPLTRKRTVLVSH